MDVDEIRKFARLRPFIPFEIHLDNGEKYLVRHPEIFVSDVVVVTLDEKGDTVYIATEAISSIKHIRKGVLRRR